MNPITRRWCLLAIAGAPIVLGISAQALSVRLDGDFLRVSAPNLRFLDGKPLARLKDGFTVGYLGQLTVAIGDARVVQARSVAHFAFSYDVWDKSFRVSVITPGAPKGPSRSNLTLEGAQAWCLNQLRVNLARISADRPIWVRLEIRSEDSKEMEGIVGDPGINLSGLVALFSHPPKNTQVHIIEEVPVNISDLRKPHS